MRPFEARSAAAKAWNLFNLASFVIGAKVSNVINAAVQLQDAQGIAIYEPGIARIFLSDSALGLGVTATVPTSPLAIGTNGFILDVDVATKMLTVQSNAIGQFDINITQTASPVSYYLVVVLPSGKMLISPVVTF